MLVVTMSHIPGYRIEAVLGDVVGAGRETLPGEVVDLMYRSREQATRAMWQQAKQRGANAVVGFNLDGFSLDGRSFGTYASGTAVWVAPIAEGEQGATPQSIEDARQRAAAGAAQRAMPPAGQPSPAMPMGQAMAYPPAGIAHPGPPGWGPPQGNPMPGYGPPR